MMVKEKGRGKKKGCIKRLEIYQRKKNRFIKSVGFVEGGAVNVHAACEGKKREGKSLTCTSSIRKKSKSWRKQFPGRGRAGEKGKIRCPKIPFARRKKGKARPRLEKAMQKEAWPAEGELRTWRIGGRRELLRACQKNR